MESETRKEFEDEELGKEAIECLSKVVKKHQSFETSAKVIILGEMGVSDEIVKAEKEIFLKKMAEMLDSILECMD